MPWDRLEEVQIWGVEGVGLSLQEWGQLTSQRQDSSPQLCRALVRRQRGHHQIHEELWSRSRDRKRRFLPGTVGVSGGVRLA